jgi:asparagine synthase (glutamine-hydrolysing)
MGDTLVHRGPDDTGVWLDASAGVALVHRRLAILDLTPAGHQPMVSASGRYVIAFNGEIYNHVELRRALEANIAMLAAGNVAGQRRASSVSAAYGWRGHSDTETLLAAFESWDVEGTLTKCVGMFSLALWDREKRALTLARDRLGEKPLYYGWAKGTLVFGSELKAIRAYPGFEARVDRGALALYMRHNYVPAPRSIYENVWKLLPGCYVQFSSSSSGASGEGQGRIRQYWSARHIAEKGLQHPFEGDAQESRRELERLLRQSIAGQMIADVPLGAFLSGGIDSSTVVALMQAQSAQAVKTFTIAFHESEYNEADHAKAVARHLGTDHTELYVTPADCLNVIPRLPTLYDEPFGDSSQVPTFLVSQLARRHVTVALSGDGGDELFGGYNRYFWAMALWRKLNRTPQLLRSLAARALTAMRPAIWNQLFGLMGPLIPQRLRYQNAGDKVHKLAELMEARDPEAIYLRLVSHWDDPEALVLGAKEPSTPLTRRSDWLECSEFAHRMMYLDTITYLPGDILAKVDRAAMGVSLETRVPFLDHRVLAFAWQLPIQAKIQNGKGKQILRDILHQFVPRDLVERPKMGFGVPIDTWLRGPLRAWAEALLDEQRLRFEGYFEPLAIRRKWQEHLSGQRNWQYLLWDVLMFQAWLETADVGRDEGRLN